MIRPKVYVIRIQKADTYVNNHEYAFRYSIRTQYV